MKARRLGWGVADQAFSSLTNFALGVVVARATDASGFGAFALAFATYVVGMNVARAVATEPLVVRHSAAPPDRQREPIAAATGSAIAVGAAGAAVCAVVALASDGALARAFAALAIGFPGLLLQDAWRFAFFAGRRGGAAFANDAIWAAVQFPALLALAAAGRDDVFTLTLAWAASGAAAGVAGIAQARVVPRPARIVAWVRAHRDLVPNFLAELLALSGARNLVLYAVGGLAGLAASAAVRGAQILMNPLHVLGQGIRLALIPDLVRALAAGGDARRVVVRPCASVALSLASMAASVGGILVSVGDGIGRALLGDTWSVAEPVVLPIAVVAAGSGLVSGASIGLRALAAARRSRRARTALSVLQLAGGIAGAVAAGAPGAAWGLAAANAAGAAIWWAHLRAALGEHRDGAPADDAVPAPIAAG